VCTARKPACPKCIIDDLCEYPHKTPASQLRKSDAPVAHEGAPPAIASRIEKALKRKAKGQLGGKSGAAGAKRATARGATKRPTASRRRKTSARS